MKITRTSMFTNIVRTKDLPVTPEQMALYESGVLIQVAFPNLSREDREFIRTGVTNEEWDRFLFRPSDEDPGENEIN